MKITESSITLDFPDNNCFRFQDCKGYKAIQNHFKEMDVCRYDQESDTLYIIELKDWSEVTLGNKEDSNKRIRDLVKKSVDSVCMFMSILLGKPHSILIQECSPFTISGGTKLRLLSIINCKAADTIYISAINSEYKSRFVSYSKLFDINSFLVLPKDKAMQRFEWIS
jgi:hypothetical protein